MSWKPEVITTDSRWTSNGLRFATEQEALNNARDLAAGWTLVRAFRSAESDDPVNYTYHDGQLRAVEAQPIPPVSS